ncbi:DUF1127 domain-containing protein [Marinibacterium profundimaris]|uniref:Leucyl-tRNA synthetase n=1 Tax=Marinibacterium profundimaris TaxID=1679460 RepID=A0A225NJ82_9RHOB|nr:DUF1127 domain-containing protein [Marinibacterium profundimaris]OWU68729.1 leucyl-tRNA synthetase [Marinibacterium profundimaris]
MAYTSQHIAPAGILSAVQHFFASIGNALVLAAEANPRMKRVQALQRLSDAQLAERGIKREDIVRVVFRDVLYL